MPYCLLPAVVFHLLIFSGRSTGFPYLGKSESIVRVCLCPPVFCLGALCSGREWVSCTASSFSLPKHCKALQPGFSCSQALFFLFFFYLYSLFKNCCLSYFIFPLQYSRLHIFVMWFHFVLSGLIKNCKNLPTASEPIVVRNKKIFWTPFFPLRLKQVFILFPVQHNLREVQLQWSFWVCHFPTSKLSSLFRMYSTRSPANIRCLN